ncbi:hypothetical protein [Luteibacter sahnii]|uniref:hypothetical protein n=1 Tax=Luteibacter sahnii TaxID=3021977 RepID=UPI002A6A8B29|nr:hypothetical protein [Luteibacter sp. PPL193]MDY1549914.1 hypothetical protein [Luteibacter sp. PPL193]
MSLLSRLEASLTAGMRAYGRHRARIHRATSLPDLLRRVGRRFTPLARRMDVILTLDVDPALAIDLRGPFGAFGAVLERLIAHAMQVTTAKRVSLSVDVVGDDARSQLVHFTVTVFGDATPADASTFGEAIALLEALGGAFYNESDERHRRHLIAELAFSLPPRGVDVDVTALRTTLGGDASLQKLVDALEDALVRDIRSLDALLAEGGVADLQTWLHRVAGVLGMAEATDLARVGLTLEADLDHGRSEWIDNAIRRFGHDAGRVLDTLRAHVGTHRI